MTTRRPPAKCSRSSGTCGGGRVLFLELGVGGNTPVIIKYPFWRMTLENRRAVYVCVNQKEASAPAELRKQTICIPEDIGAVLSACCGRR